MSGGRACSSGLALALLVLLASRAEAQDAALAVLTDGCPRSEAEAERLLGVLRVELRGAGLSLDAQRGQAAVSGAWVRVAAERCEDAASAWAVTVGYVGSETELSARARLNDVEGDAKTRTLALLIADLVAAQTRSRAAQTAEDTLPHDALDPTTTPAVDDAWWTEEAPPPHEARGPEPEIALALGEPATAEAPASEPRPDRRAFGVSLSGDLHFFLATQTPHLGGTVLFAHEALGAGGFALRLGASAGTAQAEDALGTARATTVELVVDGSYALRFDDVTVPVHVECRGGWAFVSAQARTNARSDTGGGAVVGCGPVIRAGLRLSRDVGMAVHVGLLWTFVGHEALAEDRVVLAVDGLRLVAGLGVELGR